jgi:hypothetical protein
LFIDRRVDELSEIPMGFGFIIHEKMKNAMGKMEKV